MKKTNKQQMKYIILKYLCKMYYILFTKKLKINELFYKC